MLVPPRGDHEPVESIRIRIIGGFQMDGAEHMKISIAMAAYNGSAFIRDQLDSFVTQTRRPDEIVICDDGSTDGTEQVVAEFAATAPFEIRFSPNPQRLGYTGNFERAIGLCSGDIIFLSDQDDVWFPEKIATVVQRFEDDPDALVLVNDQLMTDGALRPGTATKLQNLERAGYADDALIEGCCTALSARWARAALPIPKVADPILQKELSYDRWLNELAILLGIRRVERRVLQYFRRHGGNTTGWSLSQPHLIGMRELAADRPAQAPTAAWQRRIDILDTYRGWLEQNRDALNEQRLGDTEAALRRIEAERRSHAARIALVRKPLLPRLMAILALLSTGGYRYFFGWKSAASDVVRTEG